MVNVPENFWVCLWVVYWTAGSLLLHIALEQGVLVIGGGAS
jgi:hypothetical protein